MSSSMTYRATRQMTTKIMEPDAGKRPAARTRPNKVSPQHTLERVRNNQRRHRARRAAHVESLERNLAEAGARIVDLESQLRTAQLELAQAWHRPQSRPYSNPLPAPLNDVIPMEWSANPVFDLSHILERSQIEHYDVPAVAGAAGDEATTPHMAPPQYTTAPGWDFDGASTIGVLSTGMDSNAISSAMSAGFISSMEAPSPPGCCHASPAEQTNPHYSTPIISAMPTQPHAEQGDGKTLLCSEAYVLVARYNSKGLSSADVASWLWSGFSASVDPGDGCRVEAGLLFGLLAFISVGWEPSLAL